MTEQETVQAIIHWLESDAGDEEGHAQRLDHHAAHEDDPSRLEVRAAEARLRAAFYRLVARHIAEGRWRAHAAGVELAGDIVVGSVKVVERKT